MIEETCLLVRRLTHQYPYGYATKLVSDLAQRLRSQVARPFPVLPCGSMSETAARLDITTHDDGLALAGELDAHTAPRLALQLAELPPGDGDIVLDIGRVEFMDSSGLRVVIEAHQRASDAGRRLVLRHPTAAVNRLLEISGLSDHLATE